MNFDLPGPLWTNPLRFKAAEHLAEYQFRPARAKVARLLGGEPADPVVTAAYTKALVDLLPNFNPRSQSFLSFVAETLALQVEDYLGVENRIVFQFVNEQRILLPEGGRPCPVAIFHRLEPIDRALIRSRLLGYDTDEVAEMYGTTERSVLDAFGRLQQLRQPDVKASRAIRPGDALAATLHLRLYEQSAVYGLAIGATTEASAEALGLHPAIFQEFVRKGLEHLEELSLKGGVA